MRQCYHCVLRYGEEDSWWPLEPGTDANGDEVRFWRPTERRCYASILEVHVERHRARVAA